jgi:DNA-binding HxlR family transcriptional regulator
MIAEDGVQDEGAGTCSLAASLIRGVQLLQEKWMLLIVNRLLQGPVGFNELCREADGVNATTMALRLSQLERAGLATKTIHSTMPPRTSYALTEAGRELRPVLEAIAQWSAKHLPGETEGLPPCEG